MKVLFYPLLVLILFPSCDSTEPCFNPDKIFVEVKNGTPDSDGEFEVFNYSSQTIFIDYLQYLPCSFFIYSIEQYTDTGTVKLYFDETEGKWRINFDPDSINSICDAVFPPVEIKSLQSYKQKITGIDLVGEYRLTIRYILSDESGYYTLIADYKVSN